MMVAEPDPDVENEEYLEVIDAAEGVKKRLASKFDIVPRRILIKTVEMDDPNGIIFQLIRAKR